MTIEYPDVSDRSAALIQKVVDYLTEKHVMVGLTEIERDLFEEANQLIEDSGANL